MSGLDRFLYLVEERR